MDVRTATIFSETLIRVNYPDSLDPHMAPGRIPKIRQELADNRLMLCVAELPPGPYAG